MSELDILTAAAAGMDAQRALLDIAARNVAAAQASSPGHAYSRLVAQLVAAPAEPDADDAAQTDGDEPAAPLLRTHAEPGSGDALTEMIAVLDAQRAFESDASVFDVGKRLAERTLDVGRS